MPVYRYTVIRRTTIYVEAADKAAARALAEPLENEQLHDSVGQWHEVPYIEMLTDEEVKEIEDEWENEEAGRFLIIGGRQDRQEREEETARPDVADEIRRVADEIRRVGRGHRRSFGYRGPPGIGKAGLVSTRQKPKAPNDRD